MTVENVILELPFKGRSCYELYNGGVWNNSRDDVPKPDTTNIIKATGIVVVAVSIVVLNFLMVVVLHFRRHSRFLPPQPRMLMTSLAVTDMAVGTLVCPFAVYPTLYGCWPYGVFHCGLEALLISALFHQSTLSLVAIAIDRYMCIVHPLRYPSIVTKKFCLGMIGTSWMFSFSVYSLIIYPHSKFHFDDKGLMSCEPYYANQTIILLAISFFYFPPLGVLFYCYITIFFIAQKQLKIIAPSPSLHTISGNISQRFSSSHMTKIKRKMKLYRSSLTLAIIGFGFLLAVTPWTMTEFISSCFKMDLPSSVEFSVTWIAISNSFWNPVIYGVLSNSFREVAVDIFRHFFRKKKSRILREKG